MRNHSQAIRRVGLNAHLLSPAQTYRGAGINGYIHQLLCHLPSVGWAGTDAPVAGESAAGQQGLRYTAYLHDPTFEEPPGISVVRSRWDTRSPWRRIMWEQTRLAVLSRGLDLLHGLAFAAPMLAGCSTVVTVHDLSFVCYPNAFRPLNRTYLRLFTTLSVRRAARVIAVSESTRRDVVALCGVPETKVVAVPNGVSEIFTPGDAAAVAEFRRRRQLPGRFILFLGTLEPRKNLPRLIEAYAQLRASRPAGWDGNAAAPDQPKLVIAGGKGWFYETIFARVMELGLSDDVLFPGYVPAAELPWWYRAAELFVYPSVFEGFGLPVLEAMACGTPVITSRASSLPEVAGDGAVLVEPEDTQALARAIQNVLDDPSLRARLRVAGLAQAARFSWARTAAETVAVYEEVLGLSHRGGAR